MDGPTILISVSTNNSESEWRMKTSLKLAVLAIFLLTPASSHAADPTGALIDQSQEAQQEPQRIPDPLNFLIK
jgi:hypothetical protein